MKDKANQSWHIDIVQGKSKSRSKIKKCKKYCCSRFREAMQEKIVVHSNVYDETEWFIPGGFHIYYCPFCGRLVKGKGFGKLTGTNW